MAGGGIFLRRGSELVEMTEQPYEVEADLQTLLAEHPELLTADGEPRRWLLIGAEYGVAAEEDAGDRWSLDHLFVDQEAVPTLVEVKRSSDTRIRREVVGQMLDYAANAVSYWKPERLRADFERSCDESERDCGEVIAQAFDVETDVDRFWEDVETNLEAGKVRLVFVADEIPSELRAIVEFLNRQMSPAEVLAVEIRQYVGSDGAQTLVPRIVGQTEAARAAKTRLPPAKWDRDSWFTQMRTQTSPEEANVADQLFAWAEERPDLVAIQYGDGRKTPSAQFGIKDERGYCWPLFLYTNGSFSIPFDTMASVYPPFDEEQSRKDLLARLNAVPGVAIPDDAINGRLRQPSAPLNDSAALLQFTSVIEWALQQSIDCDRSRWPLPATEPKPNPAR